MQSGTQLDGLQPGSHTHSVAHLTLGGTHTISRHVETADTPAPLSQDIAKQRRNLAHAATAVFVRVKDKLPDRLYTVNTGVMVAGDNRLYVCAVIERVK